MILKCDIKKCRYEETIEQEMSAYTQRISSKNLIGTHYPSCQELDKFREGILKKSKKYDTEANWIKNQEDETSNAVPKMK